MDEFTWCKTFLSGMGYQIRNAIAPVRIMPWSQVYRVSTVQGGFYLKKMTAPFAIEAKLIQYLASKHPSHLPKIIGYNESLLAFIMADAGNPLRELLKKSYSIELANKAISDYAKVQLAAINDVEQLLALGVPDWRLAKLPTLYQNLIDFKEDLVEDGLSQEEMKTLIRLAPKFEALCKLLSQYNIPETLEHADFHDNNFLIKNGHITINDWGDSVIAHPFFSIISFLWSAKRNHHILEANNEYHSLKSTYLKYWEKFESAKRIEKAFQLATRINPIKFVNNFHRVLSCPGMKNLEEYKGSMATALRLYIQNLSSLPNA